LKEKSAPSEHHSSACSRCKDSDSDEKSPKKNEIIDEESSGIRKISLSECKQITDTGLVYLSHITSLRAISLESCCHVTDAGLKMILYHCKDLEDLNISGTQATRAILEYIT